MYYGQSVQIYLGEEKGLLRCPFQTQKSYFVSCTFNIFINFYEGFGHSTLFLHVFDSELYNVEKYIVHLMSELGLKCHLGFIYK